MTAPAAVEVEGAVPLDEPAPSLVRYVCPKCGGSFEALDGGTGYCWHKGTALWSPARASVMKVAR